MITLYLITALAVCVCVLVWRIELIARDHGRKIAQAKWDAFNADTRIETFQTATIQKIMSLEKQIGDLTQAPTQVSDERIQKFCGSDPLPDRLEDY